MSASQNAVNVLATVTAGVSFDIPAIDLSGDIFKVPGDATSALYAPVLPLQASEISDGTVTGDGVFDTLMKSCRSHLQAEYEAGRITGNEYTKAYIAMIETAMANATQFVLARTQAFWDAQKSQIAAITARAGLEKQKLDTALANIQANTAKAQYGQAVFSLAISEMEYNKVSYEVESILPKQLEKLTAENVLLATQNSKLLVETTLLEKQILKVEADTVSTNAQTQLICAQKANIDAQTLNEPKKGKLLDEQVESTRAQTTDTRIDGSPVMGAIGKQKDLYTQQITAYQRDSEVKAARIFSDAWITQKTIDEGLTAPTGFTNASLDQILAALKLNNGLGGSAGGSAPPIA